MSQDKNSRRTRWPLFVVLSVAAVVVVFGIAQLAKSAGSGDAGGESATFRVKRGALTISVVEAGTIQARERVIIKSQVEGQSTIIYLIPEGSMVEEGQLLVELEASRLEDDLVEQQIRVQNAEAAFIRARENLEVVKNQTKSDISKAELDRTFAIEDAKQYTEGKYPQELKEADSRITLAREELERADEKLKWSTRLFDEKYISHTELEADRLTHNRAKLDHELAVASKGLLEDYTHERQLAQLNSDVEQAEMALERVKLKSGADIVQAEADFKAKEAEFRQQQSKLEKVERQIANTRIVAPRAGLAVYATSARASWRGNDEPLDEGQSVRERQELIYLPTADEMVAEVQIHESNLDKIQLDLPVQITVDALKGRSYSGRVSKIAPLPNAHQMRMNPDLKVYRTEILLDGKNSDIRTGMSCKAEIIVEQYEDALYVPVQAVVREGNQPVAYVQTSEGVRRTAVEIGLDNNRMVRIVKGLTEGQEALLTPPLAVSTGVEEESVPRGADAGRDAGARGRPQGAREGSRAGRGEHGRESRGQGETASRQGEPGRGQSREMTAEQREAMKKRFENMTPKQREEMRKRRGGSQPQAGRPGGN